MGDGWHSTYYREIVCPNCGHVHTWPQPVEDAPFVKKCDKCGVDCEVACHVLYRARLIVKEDEWYRGSDIV